MKVWFINCQNLTFVATDHVENRLPWFLRAQVWFHLSWCKRCQVYLRQLQQTIAALARLPAKVVPPQLRADLLRQFNEAAGPE